jgi:oligopeptidase B
MKKKKSTLLRTTLLLFCLAYIIGSCDNSNRHITMNPPVAKKIKKELVIHDHTRIDNYYWFNERENPEVRKYIEMENSYAKAVMNDTEKIQEKIYNEIIGRIKQSDETVPYFKKGYYYYTRYESGKEYPVYCRKKETLEAKEEIILDVNKMAKGYEYYHVSGYSVSMDNNYIAFGVDTLSRWIYTIYFKDLTTGKILKDKLPNTTGYATWANDNKTVFYTVKEAKTLRAYKNLKHRLGTKSSGDEEVYEEKDDTYSTFVYKTKSQKYIVIGSSSTLSNEYRYVDAGTPDAEFKLFSPREKELEYNFSHYKDRFFIRTNLNAKNFRLMETPLDKTLKEHWKEVIPHSDDVLFENFEVFNNYLVTDTRANGLTGLKVINLNDHSEHFIEFKEQAYSAWISVNPEFNTDIIRYCYTSLTTPISTFDYNMETREQKLMKQEEVLGSFKPEDYISERIYGTASDGIKIPISLVYRKGMRKKGGNPLLLYGYGSYGYTIEPDFNSEILSLLDRGFIYAIAHVRGGQILGRKWYDDGKMLNKKNTFTDFNSCAEHLIKEKYTNNNKLFASGGSAGGLLIGAVINMRPDLYRGVIASVPFVDVVTTMLDENIPLTTSEYDEWGNPNEKEYYEYMLSYSPYDNVESKNYPAILVTSGLYDSQVQYWEPLKWVAKLREMKTDDNLLLIFTNMDTGHSGASGRFRQHKETALKYTFLLKLADIDVNF